MASAITSYLPAFSMASILNFVLWIFIGIIIIGFTIYFVWWKIQKNKYGQFKIIILEKDSFGNTHEHYDRGGIFLDKKTGYKLLFLEKNKKGLNPNNVPYVTSKDRKGRLIKTVYLRKIGVSNYVYIHVTLDNQANFTIGEEDLNWANQDIETIRRTFNKESWLTKYGAYIFFAITMMLIMIIMIVLFNKFEVLQKTSENLDTMGESMRLVTENLRNLSTTQLMNPNAPIIVPGRPG